MATILGAGNSHGAKSDIAGGRYAGWLQVMQTMSDALDSYRSESVVDFEGGWTELQRFAWSTSLESVWHTADRCYYLSLALDGDDEVNRRNVTLAPTRPYGSRRVLLVPPRQTITSTRLGGGQRRVMRCLIDADLVESILSTPVSAEECAQLGAFDFSGGPVEWLLFRMYREISSAELGVTIAVESIARTIAVEIARAIERQRQTSRRRLGGLPSWRMRLLLDRIHAEGPLPNVSDLAEIADMTVRHLGRSFQAEMGKTIGKFIAGAMAERAGKLLEDGVPVGAVAATLGYSSSSSFAHAFQRETGLLPSDMRRRRSHGLAA